MSGWYFLLLRSSPPRHIRPPRPLRRPRNLLRPSALLIGIVAGQLLIAVTTVITKIACQEFRAAAPTGAQPAATRAKMLPPLHQLPRWCQRPGFNLRPPHRRRTRQPHRLPHRRQCQQYSKNGASASTKTLPPFKDRVHAIRACASERTLGNAPLARAARMIKCVTGTHRMAAPPLRRQPPRLAATGTAA